MNYGPDEYLSYGRNRASPPARAPRLEFRPEELARPPSKRMTRRHYLNKPNNPTGKVFTREECVGVS